MGVLHKKKARAAIGNLPAGQRGPFLVAIGGVIGQPRRGERATPVLGCDTHDTVTVAVTVAHVPEYANTQSEEIVADCEEPLALKPSQPSSIPCGGLPWGEALHDTLQFEGALKM